MNGLLISLEGIDASGKSTTIQLVYEKLQAAGIRAISVNKKATDGYPTEFLRDYMKKVSSVIWEFTDEPVGEIPEEAWVFKHALWYTMTYNYIIKPLKEEYDVILIDGWYYKFLARHLSNGDFDFDLTFKIFDSVPGCDHVFMLDVDPAICYRRREEFKPSELGEHAQLRGASPEQLFVHYQQMVRDNYYKLSKDHHHWTYLALGNQDPHWVSLQITQSIASLLEKDGAAEKVSDNYVGI